jgi:hypothetical protein
MFSLDLPESNEHVGPDETAFAVLAVPPVTAVAQPRA